MAGSRLNRAVVEASLGDLQATLCDRFAAIDGTAAFGTDRWERAEGGGGVTRILSGQVLEKAAVNFSAVWGPTPTQLAESRATGSESFYATGLSIIVHPVNPHAPTFHSNVRYFELDTGVSWFGGGCDLTPHYLYEEDARHFHRTLARMCDRHEIANYPAWKKACDDYFFLPHRQERRGVGGVFFDHLEDDLPAVWNFVEDFGRSLIDAYEPVLVKRIDHPYTEAEKLWQELRRGRYVEFNLVWDRGTRFGLETGGRTESILASLPPRARWTYGYVPGPSEAPLVEVLSGQPRDWAEE